MKRKILIEEMNCHDDSFSSKLIKQEVESVGDTLKELKMFEKTEWYNSLVGAEKSCINDEKIKKIHYKFADNREMVEEYNLDTYVMLRRAWKVKGELGGEGKWDVEIGDPIPEPNNIEQVGIIESNDQPSVLRRNTRVNLEWRIRNLPYSYDTYSITLDNNDKCIVVRTSNKKYFKKLLVPEIIRLGLQLDPANLSSNHQYNTLIIQYKKPKQLLDMEKALWEELIKIKPKDFNKDMPGDCKTS